MGRNEEAFFPSDDQSAELLIFCLTLCRWQYSLDLFPPADQTLKKPQTAMPDFSPTPLPITPTAGQTLPSFQGHCALITGASSGIGAAFAQALAAQGAHLILVARREDRLQEQVATFKRKYPQQSFFALAIDLSKPDASAQIFATITEQLQTPPVTVLINNAGIGKYGPFQEFSLREHLETLQVNVVAPTELSYGFLTHQRGHQKPSYLVQIASISAYQPVGYFTVYSATKGYLRSFSETLNFELKNTNVSCTCICPGGTKTEFFKHSGQTITPSGAFTLMSAQAVAEQSLKAVLKRKAVFIPGWINQLACFLPRFLPSGLALKLAFLAMNRAVTRVKNLPTHP